MATKAAFKRVSCGLDREKTFRVFYLREMPYADLGKQLTREYQNVQKNPPPFIVAHPSESNILESVLPLCPYLSADEG